MRLINADELINDIQYNLWDWQSVDGITATTVLKQTITDIKNEPTIDAVPVVRCRDCINNILGENYNPLARHKRDCIFKPDNWFCADGERRNDDKEAD